MFRYLETFLLLFRFVILIFFATQTLKHLKRNGHKTDPYTLVTFVCLGLSFFIFLIYGSLHNVLAIILIEAKRDPEALRNILQWLLDHQKALNLTFALLRHPAYLLDNLAFTSNIARWALIVGQSIESLERDRNTPPLKET